MNLINRSFRKLSFCFFRKICFNFLIISLITSCSTMSFKNKTLLGMAVGSGVGFAVGKSQAPKKDDSTMHGALWGLGAATIAALSAVFFHDHDKEIKEKNKRLLEFRRIIEEQKKGKKEVVGFSQTLTGFRDLPKDLKKLVTPGEWKLYEINFWKKDENGALVHSDKLLEFTNPEINNNIVGE